MKKSNQIYANDGLCWFCRLRGTRPILIQTQLPKPSVLKHFCSDLCFFNFQEAVAHNGRDASRLRTTLEEIRTRLTGSCSICQAGSATVYLSDPGAVVCLRCHERITKPRGIPKPEPEPPSRPSGLLS